LGNQHRRRADQPGQLNRPARLLFGPFTQFHAHIISDARRFDNSDA
jgi:hypothetical protein